MKNETMEIVIEVLADKVRLLEWQLKDAEERKWKFKEETVELKEEIDRLKKVIGEMEEEENA